MRGHIALWMGWCATLIIAFAATVVLLFRRLQSVVVHPWHKWTWLAYSTPCVLAWCYYLWVFWPGLMSYDSFAQWHQVTNGQFDNWHPAFHTMTIWLITRVWNSPAAIALTQILVLSAVVGWGLAMLRQKGMSRWLAVTICLLLALSPANGCTVITLWKDIPYSTCLLLMGLLTIEIVTSEGAWLERKWAWVFLGIVAALTALYRHNGLPVAFGSLVILLLVYREQWRKFALALSLAFVCWLGVCGPLYNYAGVKPMPATLALCPVLHHIAAHSVAGTPLTADQQALMAEVHPLIDGKWPYDPTNVEPMFDGKLNVERVEASRSELIRLFLSLAWRRPMVDLKHIVLNSAMMWRITQPGMMFALNIVNGKALRMNPEIRNDPRQIIGGPLVEVAGALPPGLAASVKPEWSWCIWHPALPLYLLLLGAVVAAVRARRWQYLLFAMPAGLQSLCLAMVITAPDFRYQWGVSLMGVIVGGFTLFSTPRRIAADAANSTAGSGSSKKLEAPRTLAAGLSADNSEPSLISLTACSATSSNTIRYDDVAVLIPCYNEELSIAKVVRDFSAALPGARIYVFDNNSSDRTGSLAREAGACVVQSPRQGKGHVVRHMFDAVDANFYVMADGDDTYPADAAGELIALARGSGADMVVGTRLEQFQSGSFRRFHRLGNRMITRLLSSIFGVRVTDVLSGYRVFSREFVRSIPVMSPGFEIETELTLHAMAKKFMIREQPVAYGQRPQGSPSKLRTYRDGYHILKTIFLIFKDYKPLTFFGTIAILIAICSFLAGLPAIVDYVTMSVVLHLPLAVLAASLAVVSTLSMVIGLLLHTLRNYHNENMELFRRCIAQVDRLRQSGINGAASGGKSDGSLLSETFTEQVEKDPQADDHKKVRVAA